MISFCVAPSLPKAIFSAMVVAKRTGSWFTTPIKRRKWRTLNDLMSWPSSNTYDQKDEETSLVVALRQYMLQFLM
jgi:hypothetical protein